MAKVLEALSGWQLLFREDAPTVTLKGVQRFSSAKKINEALVMVWRRQAKTGVELQLLVRSLSTGAEKNSNPWLSVSREWNLSHFKVD